MHVGVFPQGRLAGPGRTGLPHARGGVSRHGSGDVVAYRSSPCTWGCFSDKASRIAPVVVFPMHVGVFPDVRKE